MSKAAQNMKPVADPVFAAIEARKAAVIARQPVSDKYMITSFDAPEWNLIVIETEALFAAERAVEIELTKIKPTSVAGAMALLVYYTEQTDRGHVWIGGDLIDEDAGDTEPRSFEACLIRSVAASLAKIGTAAAA